MQYGTHTPIYQVVTENMVYQIADCSTLFSA